MADATITSKAIVSKPDFLPGLLEMRILERSAHKHPLAPRKILGAGLVLAGAATWIFGLNYWRSHHFGPLDPDKTLRIVIPGFVSLTLSIEIVLSSFFVSVLGMARK